ncbi:MAG: NYN domain-containing protein [Deltaproteobacteria bacterium]|nr:MAG: NYN domain-containing protein [Deltaproteobacteria bacterium]
MYNNGSIRVGVYVDVVNLTRNGGYGMQYDVLREFATRDWGEPVRLNAYVAYDEERSYEDEDYEIRARDFQLRLRDFGYKVTEKRVQWFSDEWGNRYGKANADLEMAVDVLLQSDKLDRVLLATGDGDFRQVTRALQNKGCRVEVVAFKNVAPELRDEADTFVSGYQIPNLLPSKYDSDAEWGEVGSRVRGVCYVFYHQKRFGFLRFLKEIAPGIWITDARREDSPYATAFAHGSNFPPGLDLGNLPSRDFIFEFDLSMSDRGLQATNIELVHQY